VTPGPTDRDNNREGLDSRINMCSLKLIKIFTNDFRRDQLNNLELIVLKCEDWTSNAITGRSTMHGTHVYSNNRT
jgi:hypothetical protein